MTKKKYICSISVFVLFVCIVTCIATTCIADSHGKALYPTQNIASGLWGYVDAYGTIVIDFQYEQAFPFRGSFAKVCAQCSDDNALTSTFREGIIDQEGNWTLPPMYRVISNDNFGYPIGIASGIGIFVIENEDGVGFFNANTGFFSGIQYDFLSEVLWYGATIDCDLICVEINNMKGFVDLETGENVIECRYSPYYQYYFHNGFCVVTENDGESWLLIDKQGNEVLLPEDCCVNYSSVRVSDDLFPVYNTQKNLYGYCNIAGDIVIEPQYLFANSFHEGIATVEMVNGEWIYISATGNIIAQCGFIPGAGTSNEMSDQGMFKYWNNHGDLIYSFPSGIIAFTLDIDGLRATSRFMQNGLAFYYINDAEDNTYAGLFNIDGTILTEPIFVPPGDEYTQVFTHSLILPLQVAESQYYGCLNEHGSWEITPAYSAVYFFDDNIAMVGNDHLIIIDSKGLIVYDSIKDSNDE